MVSEASASAIVTPPVHRRAPGKARRRASWDSGWRRASRCRMEPHASQNATVQAGPLSKTMIRVTMAAKPSIGSSDPKIIQWPRAPPRQASLGRARARVRTGRACCAGLHTAPIAPDRARRILAASHGATRGPGAIGRAPPLGAVDRARTVSGARHGRPRADVHVARAAPATCDRAVDSGRDHATAGAVASGRAVGQAAALASGLARTRRRATRPADRVAGVLGRAVIVDVVRWGHAAVGQCAASGRRPERAGPARVAGAHGAGAVAIARAARKGRRGAPAAAERKSRAHGDHEHHTHGQ